MSTTTDNVSRDQLNSRLAGYHVGDKVAIAVGQAWYVGIVTKLTKTKVHVTFTKGTGYEYTKAVDPYEYGIPSVRATGCIPADICHSTEEQLRRWEEVRPDYRVQSVGHGLRLVQSDYICPKCGAPRHVHLGDSDFCDQGVAR
jgi:hypothetical protein